MATTIGTPDADQTCAYCGSRIFDHDPICVRDCTEACGSPTYFCNHACLAGRRGLLLTGHGSLQSTDLVGCSYRPVR